MAPWIILAALLLFVAAWVQLRVPLFTAGRSGVTATRVVLAGVGIAFGFTVARLYAGDTVVAVLAFAAGFGLVHVPAAFILLFKRKRGEGRS